MCGNISNHTRRLISLTKKDVAIFTNMFIAHKHKGPKHLWDMFKAEVNRLSTLHIPTRQIKSRVDLPWVTHEIVKVIRKRDKLYIKLKRSCSHKSHYTEKFKHLKSTIQKQIRNACWSYLESVIFSETQDPGHKKVLQLC